MLVLGCLSFASCHVFNIAAGPDDFERHHYAGMLKSSIDDGVRDEIAKEPPNGYKTQRYRASLWQEYWNRRIHRLGDMQLSGAYRGPSGLEWVNYIIRSREKAGLPALRLEPRNREIVRQAKLLKPSPDLQSGS